MYKNFETDRIKKWYNEDISMVKFFRNIDNLFTEAKNSIPIELQVKPACERKLIISIENDTVLFENLNDFKPLEFMGILHNAISTADVLYKTKVMQMVDKASKSV